MMKAPKVLLTGAQWYGDLLTFVERALHELGVEVRVITTNRADWMDDATHLRQLLARLPLAGARLDWELQQRQQQRLANELQQKLVEAIKEWQPDLLLSILCWNEPITDIALDELPGFYQIAKAAWLMDDPFQHDGRLAGLMSYYDRIYVVDGSWEEPIRLFTGRPTAELTCGADLLSYHPVPPEAVPAEYYCGLAFVGSSYHGHCVGRLRYALLERVADLRLQVYGDQGWTVGRNGALADCYRGGELSSVQANLAYNGAEIVLNIHHPQFRVGTSLRTFAICAAGAFQLVDWRPGLERFFVPGEEIATYRTADELREQARYYLSNPSARRRIARAGYERARREHTYTQRIAHILRDADLLPTRQREDRSHTSHALSCS